MAAESTPSIAETSSLTISSDKRKKDHFAQLGFTLIGPRDQCFKDRILDPLGIIWNHLPQPDGKPPPFLRSEPLPHARVIIRYDDKGLDRIKLDFEEYISRPYDEQTLVALCWDSIMLRDTLVVNSLDDGFSDDIEEEMVVQDQEVIRTSVRRDRWKPKKQGPSMPHGKFVFDWEIEPDTSYAVSIRLFNLEYRQKLHLDVFQPWIAEKDVSVCPYLTVEYKCVGKGGKQMHTTNQSVTAAVLWLYQRKCLRSIIEKASDGLRHFLITIVDSTYVISVARLKGNRYIVSELVAGNLIKTDDLKIYIEWSNAIHAWGLGAHASSFKKDIEELAQLKEKQKPSNFPTPAGTTSSMAPPLQGPRQVQENGSS